ncbi:hypothetical protein COR50_13780 [Chitinophaga caeni]|uniref:Uncharacterized protein n=2 Tax=Chitinophaga caeni TaxID=2029983 RepID=A0A291QW03_9BACT|nr:hypothetical protein COR50_13780 [Chitinophaga caeni]
MINGKLPGSPILVQGDVFTNPNLSGLSSSSLSVIRQPIFDTGQAATGLLTNVIEIKRPITESGIKILGTHMITRESWLGKKSREV